MKIVITIEDTEDGHIKVSEVREPGVGEEEESVTSASSMADALFAVMDQLGDSD